MDFDNVIQTLKSRGFTTDRPTGMYYLRIQNEFVDKKQVIEKYQISEQKFAHLIIYAIIVPRMPLILFLFQII